ncbi:L,D-transpeptidase [Cyanobium sp. N.Huapi 1H5]|uniref:L,D-transpeptidase n=1 Tax=Cyanobium sp. N.Huapi 1H5 TaxID=2823719 RepID=UPI0020CB6AA2|nr:L,D-transpeptidase [Cyanobium sp. N.Huapi 1H5]
MNRQAILPLALALFSCLWGWSVEPAMAAAADLEPAAATPGPAATPPEPTSPPLQLVLDRRKRLLKVMEGDRERRRFRVGVGMPGWETPVGSFSVIEKTAYPIWEHPAKGVRIPPGPTNPLGSRWIGFHRDCKGRRGFNGQEHLEVKGCVTSGFHGTPNRDSVGGAVSHGCVRLFDEDVKELFEMVQVGTPVTVLP